MVLGCEEWRSVVGYEGLYEVSNLGRVLSLPRNAASWITDEEKHKRGKLLSVSRNTVCLCKNNQRQVCALKDIVLQAFVDPSVRHFDVDYLDNDISNCSLSNLKIRAYEELEDEIWRDIEGYETKYQVSSHGRVRIKPHTEKCVRGDTQKEYIRYYGCKLMKLLDSMSGYYQIHLWMNNTVATKLVHRLVAQAFVPNPSNLPQVNHKDLDKKNNHYTNLEWAARTENVKHDIRTGAFKCPEGRKRHVPRKLYCVELDKTFNTVKEAAEAIGSNYQYLFDRMRANLPCHGYTFKDVNNNR